MNTTSFTAVLVSLIASSDTVMADERIDHFEGQPSETLEQAFENLAATNAMVADILAQDEITMADLARIHELTYTLENALERIDDEYDELEDQLEALHLASEGADTEHARSLGRTYLENAGRFHE